MTNAIQKREGGAVADRPLSPVEQVMSQRSDQLAQVLPEHVTPERFIRVITNAALRSPDLHKAEAPSLFSAAMQCAQDGLLPDGREAALTTFRERKTGKINVTYIPMVAGVVKKVLQSGEVLSIGAHVVYSADVFEYWIDNDGEHMRHMPMLTGPRGEMIGVYASAKLKNGGFAMEFLRKDEVDRIKGTSRQSENEYGPWVQHYDEMSKKTAIHRLAKRLPMSSEAMDVIQRDHALYDYDERTQAVTVTQPAKGRRALLSAAAQLDALQDLPEVETSTAEPTNEETATNNNDVIEADFEDGPNPPVF